MSRSTFLTSFETGETNNSANNEHNQFVRIHHRLIPTISGNSRSNESLPIVVVQKNSSNLNPKLKRNLRGKRRSTGIRSDDVALASALNEPDDDDDQNSFVPNETKTIETFETNRTVRFIFRFVSSKRKRKFFFVSSESAETDFQSHSSSVSRKREKNIFIRNRVFFLFR